MVHRVILGIVFEGRAKQGDHINHDTLNNRRNNLRIVPNRENAANRIDQSKYGVEVTFDKSSEINPYRVRVLINDKVFSRNCPTPSKAQQTRLNILEEHGLA